MSEPLKWGVTVLLLMSAAGLLWLSLRSFRQRGAPLTLHWLLLGCREEDRRACHFLAGVSLLLMALLCLCWGLAVMTRQMSFVSLSKSLGIVTIISTAVSPIQFRKR